MSKLHWMSAKAVAAAIANREMSPVELVNALLDRIERLNPRLNVFIRIEAEAALKEARAAEAEAARGRLRGALHGVPVGIKDIIDVSGLPTTCHSKILENRIARADAECVARLRAAGAIILGISEDRASISPGRRHEIPGTAIIIPVDHPPDRAADLLPASFRWRSEPTPGAVCATPRARARSWAPSRLTGSSPAAASFHLRLRSITSVR